MDLTSSSAIAERSRGSFMTRQKKGNTNGLAQPGLRVGGSLHMRNTFSATSLFLGAVLYGVSLMWPLAALTPQWVAYPLAIAGISLVLLSLRSMPTSIRRRGRRG